jgi:hypothetical protein
MKKIIAIVFILTLAFSSVIYAGNDKESGNTPMTTSISGKVVDMDSMEELVGVSVQIEGTDIKAYTDMEGNFKIEDVQPGTYNLTISYISYEETELKEVSIDPASTDELEIKIEQIK